MRPKVLSFTTVFPRAGGERQGTFVRARLEAAAAHAEIQVMAPVAVVEYGNAGRALPPLAGIPLKRAEGGLVIHHPRWFYPPLMNPATPWWLYRACRGPAQRLREEFRFELIDAHWGHPEGGAAARLAREAGVPFTVTLRGNELEHARSAARRRALGAALRKAARVMAVSQELAEFAASLGVERERIRMVPNGVDARVFHPRDRAAERARLGMGDGAFHLLTAGHLIELKGHHRVIEAAARLRAEGLDARVWIAGGAGRRGDYREQIVRTAERTGMGPYTSLLGELAPEDLAGAMTACDVFCLASAREGWPNVVNEALACGAPVAAARAGAVPEMLAEAGLGVIVDSNEPGALAEGLRRALASSWDRAEIARRGQARSWEQTAQQVAAVWRECLEEGRR